jgi:hypothetical protein
LIEYRVDSVKHATSPSRRDCPRQVVISHLVQIQLVASEHKKPFSRHADFLARFTLAHLAPLRRLVGWLVRISLFKANEAPRPRLRNFDTEPHSPYCYGVSSDNRLESVANAHTAADLHVRPVSQTALV